MNEPPTPTRKRSRPSRPLILRSEDGQDFTVDYEDLKLSKLVIESIDDHTNITTHNTHTHNNLEILPLLKIKGVILSKVIEFCQHYTADPMTPISMPFTSDLMEDMVQPWYCAYSSVDDVMKYELLSAANFMNIEPLMDLMCLKISVMIKGKSGDEIRRIFNIPLELSPEEEEEIHEENSWAVVDGGVV